MKRSRLAASLLTLALTFMLVLSLTGCKASDSETAIEGVLQLDNDILEDPLLKELDALEESLLSQAVEPLVTTPSVEAVQEPDQEVLVAAAPVSKQQAAESAHPVPSPSSDTTVPQVVVPKKITFGIVKRTDDAGVSLRVIQAKPLSMEELRRIKNGEKVPRALLTDEIVKFRYSSSAVFEKLENDRPVPATLSEVVSGQTVRVTWNGSGEITLLRILRN